MMSADNGASAAASESAMRSAPSDHPALRAEAELADPSGDEAAPPAASDSAMRSAAGYTAPRAEAELADRFGDEFFPPAAPLSGRCSAVSDQTAPRAEAELADPTGNNGFAMAIRNLKRLRKVDSNVQVNDEFVERYLAMCALRGHRTLISA